MSKEQERIKLYNADCLEILKTLPDKSVDLILQDPPYNTTACKWEWDIITKIDEFWAEWKRVIKDNGAIVMTASQPFTSKLVMSNLKMFKYEWVWEKNTGAGFIHAKNRPLKRHENIIVFSNGSMGHKSLLGEKRLIYNPQGLIKEIKIGKNGISGTTIGKRPSNKDNNVSEYKNYPTTILKINNDTGLHPTQKPVALMEYLIKTYTNEGDTVFDGFMGSGSTLVACKNLNRKGIGIELDEKYFKIAEERINNTPDKLL